MSRYLASLGVLASLFALTQCVHARDATGGSSGKPGSTRVTQPLLDVPSAISLCSAHPSGIYSAHVWGFFVWTIPQHGGSGGLGRLYPRRKPNLPGVVVGDSTPYLFVRWGPPHGIGWIPSAHWVVLRGRLDCSGAGYPGSTVLVSRWQPWSPARRPTA